jgi:MFS family permease
LTETPPEGWPTPDGETVVSRQETLVGGAPPPPPPPPPVGPGGPDGPADRRIGAGMLLALGALALVALLVPVWAAALAAAALVSGSPAVLALVLAAAGSALGTLFITLYLLVDELTPRGARTRAFGWLVAANNGGLGLGAAVAGELIPGHGGATGLWIGAACALMGIPFALAVTFASSPPDPAGREPERSA